jgi:outer membrane protein assembly factor BamD
MVFLRNWLASYEVYVAEYYLKRGAWVGAINRCKYAIENYDSSPQIKRALAIMAESYRRLGMSALAADTEKVLKENTSPDRVAQGEKKSWWKIW